MKSHGFFKNTTWIIAGNILQAILSFVMSMLIARYLQPANYGLLAYSTSIVAIFSTFSSLGFADISLKFFDQYPDQHGVILGTGITLRIVASLLSTILVVVVLAILDPTNHLLLIIATIQMIGVLLQSFSLLSQWFQFRLESQVYILTSLVAYILVSIYKILCLMHQASLVYFAFVSILEYLIISTILFLSYKKSHGDRFQFSKSMAKEMFLASYHFIISGLMVIAYNQEDRIMLGTMQSQASTGIYTVAMNLCTAWTFILGAIISSASPTLFRLHRTDQQRFAHRFAQLNFTIIAISLTAAICITILSKWIIIFFYGPLYERAILPLVILSYFCMFQYLGIIRSIWLTCNNLQKYEKMFSFYGLLCNLVLNYILIPRFDIIGAALATLLTQFFVNILIAAMIRDLRPYFYLLRQALHMNTLLDTEDRRMLHQFKERIFQR